MGKCYYSFTDAFTKQSNGYKAEYDIGDIFDFDWGHTIALKWGLEIIIVI